MLRSVNTSFEIAGGKRIDWRWRTGSVLVGVAISLALLGAGANADLLEELRTRSDLLAESDVKNDGEGDRTPTSNPDTPSDDENSLDSLQSDDEPQSANTEAADALQQAAALATQAELLTQTAATAAQWDAVVAQWMAAIAHLQSIPVASPSRIMAQRQIRRYLQPLNTAQLRAEQASTNVGLASLGSNLFDAQLAGYLSYVATVGTPDILIVGSSRALQGIDPQALQQTLSAQGHGDLKVFNFSVNGATAQVVEFVVTRLLPKPLPGAIVWGDGSRAFNEGRRDRTWESLLASPGYRALENNPQALSVAALTANPSRQRITARSPLTLTPNDLDALGFSAVDDRFNPQVYYQQIPKVEGRYDGAYAGFSLNGTQAEALGRLAKTSKAEAVQLLFVNLPLSGSYLDSFRLYYEQQFQQFLQTQSSQYGFTAIDLLTQWENQPGFFADPSHINREGGRAIAQQLAQHPALVEALSSDTLSPIPEPATSPSEPVEPIETVPTRRPPPPIPPPPSKRLPGSASGSQTWAPRL